MDLRFLDFRSDFILFGVRAVGSYTIANNSALLVFCLDVLCLALSVITQKHISDTSNGFVQIFWILSPRVWLDTPHR